MEDQQVTPKASVLWMDEDENSILEFEWDANGLRITSGVIDKFPVNEEEAVQLRDFLNEKLPRNGNDPAVSQPGEYGQLAEGDSPLGNICPGCQQALEIGDKPAMVAIGPGLDPDARKAAREGRGYQGVAVVCHEECVHG